MEKTWILFIVGSFSGALLALLLICALIILFFKPFVKLVVGLFTKRIMNKRYPENIWEMVTALTRTSPITVVENSIRAADGQLLERPFGSPRKFLNFDGLVFSPAQIAVMPAHEDTEVDMKVTIGPKAKKPLTIEIPLLLGGWGYGIGVSEQIKLAAAKGTAAVGTATNTGEGGFLPEDRELSKYMIMQYGSGHWNKDPNILRQADAIEIHFGQGASAATASRIPPEFLQGKAREILNVKPGETLVIPSKHRQVQKPRDLKPLVEKLKKITDGVPIGIKISPSGKLEDDLEIAIQAKIDFISIDGGQAGTKGAPPILEDDFGIPTIFALCRAVRYLEQRGVKNKISLLIGGGFSNPGQCLKAISLGADAVFMGTIPLWAMTHDQVTKAAPWEPPTELAFYPGSLTKELDIDKSAKCLENFFNSYVEEMKVAIRSLGKDSIHAVQTGDLIALDEVTSKVTGIPLVYQTPPPPPSNEYKTEPKKNMDWRSVFPFRK
ncbi:glutamate synthase [Ammoniphilus oxalaticus]|uniref:Glutamate synthase n=1 Tax=Ammoniphilus oxalaticus TaxID=66863 RepID=A0A419SDG4_9BACL|nr:FMN-binding glutamate synthase family protein [Ammoniphilus oxalaticus]RKD21030.1 glutamate synthase [Ammoniphilus oxalaticus]